MQKLLLISLLLAITNCQFLRTDGVNLFGSSFQSVSFSPCDAFNGPQYIKLTSVTTLPDNNPDKFKFHLQVKGEAIKDVEFNRERNDIYAGNEIVYSKVYTPQTQQYKKGDNVEVELKFEFNDLYRFPADFPQKELRSQLFFFEGRKDDPLFIDERDCYFFTIKEKNS